MSAYESLFSFVSNPPQAADYLDGLHNQIKQVEKEAQERILERVPQQAKKWVKEAMDKERWGMKEERAGE